MGYREVKVYDGEFPTHEQIISGDPTAPPFPKETWREQMQPGEFAVRLRDAKTGLPIGGDGKIPGKQSEAICRIYENLAEANSFAVESTRDRVGIDCRIFDHTGMIITTIRDQKEALKFSAVLFGGTLLWITAMTLAGMAIIWLVLRTVIAVPYPYLQDALAFGWRGWTGVAFAGFALSVLGFFAKARFAAHRRWKKVRAEMSPEEWTKYEALNQLFGSADPRERERFLALKKEFEERLREIHKK
jgi:hypothetical protein